MPALSLKNDIFTMKNIENIVSVRFGGTLEGRKINAEFSLQTPSQNSRENIQRQCWSQIRKL